MLFHFWVTIFVIKGFFPSVLCFAGINYVYGYSINILWHLSRAIKDQNWTCLSSRSAYVILQFCEDALHENITCYRYYTQQE